MFLQIDIYKNAIGYDKTFTYNYAQTPVIFIPETLKKQKTNFQRIFKKNTKRIKKNGKNINNNNDNNNNNNSNKRFSTLSTIKLKFDQSIKNENGQKGCCTIS